MVDGQIRTVDVTDRRLIGALLDVPRERFVPKHAEALAYLDKAIPLGSGRQMMAPMMIARVLHAAEVLETDRVLVVGCGTGYAAAVLAQLTAHVTALEEDADLLVTARTELGGLGNVALVEGPLAAGCPDAAPFDVIVLDGALEVMPPALEAQLAEGGRLVGILAQPGASRIMRYQRIGDDVSGCPVYDGHAAILPGFRAEKTFVF